MPEFDVPEYRVSCENLRPGVFIKLTGLKWYEHPFLYNSFKIKDDEQIQILKNLGITEVICIPGKSDVLPLAPHEARPDASQPAAPSPAKPPPPPAKPAGPDPATLRLWEQKKERAERLVKKKQEIAQVEKRYASSQKRVTGMMQGIAAGNPEAVQEAIGFAGELAGFFLEDTESTLYLVNLSAADETAYYHSINVSVLSMMLGRKAGIDPDRMRVLSLGALFHDIGKTKIDRKVLLKRGPLTKAEHAWIEMHPKLGVEILARAEEFSQKASKDALRIVLEHHERCNGQGYPQHITGPQIDEGSKIVAIANTYDNLCNATDPVDSLTPYEALSYMFAKLKGHFDEKLLALFIHCLGIYPPGTLVQLTNGAIGMAISVNPENQLWPSVIIYDPEIPKREAIIIDLKEEPDLKIARSVRPASLPPEVFEYLAPRTRITYFVDNPEEAKKT